LEARRLNLEALAVVEAIQQAKATPLQLASMVKAIAAGMELLMPHHITLVVAEVLERLAVPHQLLVVAEVFHLIFLELEQFMLAVEAVEVKLLLVQAVLGVVVQVVRLIQQVHQAQRTLAVAAEGRVTTALDQT
jgi:hypothetical protein